VQRPRLSEPSSSYTQSLFHASQLSYRRLLRVITLLRAAPGRRQRRPSHSCHSPRNPVLSDAPPFRRHTSSARSREPRPRQAPPGAAARGHSSMRIPEPLVDPVWPSSRFMRAPLARNSSGAHQPVPSSGSVGMTPASTKTTGTKNARWRVLVTMVANAPRSNRRAFIVQPERRLPSSMAPGRGLSLASPAPVPVVAARYFRRREAKREPSSESTNSPAAAVYWSASRGGHGDEGTAASAARQRRTPFQLCCAPPGRDRCEDLTPWGCLTRDHPEERTPLAWNSAHCDAFRRLPLATPGPNPDFRHQNRLPERGTTRPHPSRDSPVSNDAFAMEPPPGTTPSKNVHCRQLRATSACWNNAPGLHDRERGAQGASGSLRPGRGSPSALPRRSAIKPRL
jgi:hypothetical protein